MDEQQRKAFERALERKAEQAKVASEATKHDPPPEVEGVAPIQHDLIADSQNQDTYSVRGKNSGHGKKTADKWNQ